MASISHISTAPSVLRATIEQMDAISQKRFRFIEWCAARLLNSPGEQLRFKLLERIGTLCNEAANDINCAAEDVGCNHTGARA